jgi:hypothetical protein
MSRVLDIPDDYVSVHFGQSLTLCCDSESALGALILRMWQSGQLREISSQVVKHLDLETLCQCYVLEFLNSLGEMPVVGQMSLTSQGWRTWVELNGEALDVVMYGDRLMWIVQPVGEFCEARGVMKRTPLSWWKRWFVFRHTRTSVLRV